MLHKLYLFIEEGRRRVKGKWVQAPCLELFRAFGNILGEVDEIGAVLGQFPRNFPVLLSDCCWFLNSLFYFHHFQLCFCDDIFQNISSCFFIENHDHRDQERYPMCFLYIGKSPSHQEIDDIALSAADIKDSVEINLFEFLQGCVYLEYFSCVFVDLGG